MKKTILFIAFFIFFAIVMPKTSLFADIGFGGRLDAGLNLFALPNSLAPADDEITDDGIRITPIIPLIDAGIYGQFNFGMLGLGAGIRGFSIIVYNVFWPSVYAELNIWRFTLNARIGGGVLYLFPIFLVSAPYFIPELSLWFTLATIKGSQLRLGLGAISLLSSQRNLNEELFRDMQNFNNNMVGYLALKVSFYSPWKAR